MTAKWNDQLPIINPATPFTRALQREIQTLTELRDINDAKVDVLLNQCFDAMSSSQDLTIKRQACDAIQQYRQGKE